MSERDDERREEIVGDFLQGGPRSEEWRQWREALEGRLKRLKNERAELSPGQDSSELTELITDTEDQINALATEEIISEFVEAEIHISLNTAEQDEELDGFSGNGHY